MFIIANGSQKVTPLCMEYLDSKTLFVDEGSMVIRYVDRNLFHWLKQELEIITDEALIVIWSNKNHKINGRGDFYKEGNFVYEIETEIEEEDIDAIMCFLFEKIVNLNIGKML